MSGLRHEPALTYHPGWGEWRSDCSCGRVGDYVRSKSAALAAWLEHANAAEENGDARQG